MFFTVLHKAQAECFESSDKQVVSQQRVKRQSTSASIRSSDNSALHVARLLSLEFLLHWTVSSLSQARLLAH
jgi:hypothetical protein